MPFMLRIGLDPALWRTVSSFLRLFKLRQEAVDLLHGHPSAGGMRRLRLA